MAFVRGIFPLTLQEADAKTAKGWDTSTTTCYSFAQYRKSSAPVCNGSQFRPEVLEVTYKGASIKDVLNLSIEEAAELFADVPKILRILNLLMDVGLNYLQLGQSLTTLSGGECQRLRLAKELIQTASNKECLYLMDEPTAGLHPSDTGISWRYLTVWLMLAIPSSRRSITSSSFHIATG